MPTATKAAAALECAPDSGQVVGWELTGAAGLSKDGSHGQAPHLQHRIGPKLPTRLHDEPHYRKPDQFERRTFIGAKFMLPWSFSEETAAEKYMAQLQHNMWVVVSRMAVLSVITGGGKWVEITTHADPLYQHLLLTAERKFWRCVESGEPPRLFGIE